MNKCKHGVLLPKDPRFRAEDVCSICKGLPEDKITAAIMNDEYADLSDGDLYSILANPEFDHTVKDYVKEEISSRRSHKQHSQLDNSLLEEQHREVKAWFHETTDKNRQHINPEKL